MTSYGMPQGLLADQYAGAFNPRQGLLADPGVMMQAMQAAKSMGLLDGRGMGNDSVQMPAADPTMPVTQSGPLPEAPMGPGGFAQTPGGKPGTMGGAGTQPGQPTGPGPMPANMTPEQFQQAQATAQQMMASKPGGTMGGAATQAGQPGAATGPGPQMPGRQIPSGFAMPISPRAALSDIYGMYAPAASAEGKLPPMGLGGLRRMYASPETLAAEAEAAKAAAAKTTAYDGYGPNGRPYDAGGGDGQGTQAGDQQEGGMGAASTGTSAGVGGGASTSGGLGGNAAGATGSSQEGGGGDEARRGAYVTPDGDGKLEPRKYTLHEGEVVMNPEATSLLGPDRLMEVNRMALRKKRRGLLDD